MDRLVAYSAFAMTVSLSVTRPRIGRRWQVDPAHAAGISVAIMMGAGVVSPGDVWEAGRELWRPFVTIVSIMISTAAAHRLGVLERLGEMIFSRPGVGAPRLFAMVFGLSVLTSTLLNNDAAVLLMTPLVLALVAEKFPGQPALRSAFAFSVFTAVGVAPFFISNPMNMIVAAYAGLDFNEYAARMLPIAVAGWIVAFAVLRLIFAKQLREAPAPLPGKHAGIGLSGIQKWMLALLAATIGCYPIIALVDSSAIWIVSASGAVAALALARWGGGLSTPRLLATGVAWNVLAFLLAVFVLAIGLRNVGLVDQLSRLYAGAGIGTIGTTAALGSAALNNHPMAIINMMALESTARNGVHEVLAVLIGGDLGPRLLPMGSLAGLLWLDACRRHDVAVPVGRFVRVGASVTVPTLILSLLILRIL